MDGACRAIALKDELARRSSRRAERWRSTGARRCGDSCSTRMSNIGGSTRRARTLQARRTTISHATTCPYCGRCSTTQWRSGSAAGAGPLCAAVLARAEAQHRHARVYTLHASGIALALLSLALTVVLLLTEEVRWYRLCVIPPLFLATASLLTARCGVCPFLQLQGRMMPAAAGDGQKASWLIVVTGQCDADMCAVRDAEVRRELAITIESNQSAKSPADSCNEHLLR